MRYEHKELIHDYLNIDRQIKRVKERMDKAEKEYRSLNYYGGTIFNDPMGVKRKSFRLELEVCGLIDYINICERNIKKYRRKQRYFQTYTDTLDPRTLDSLERRYGNISRLDDMQELGHDEQVLDEILEIEEAISHEFDFEKLPEFDKRMVLVESNDLKPDTLEDSFDTMLEVLGV